MMGRVLILGFVVASLALGGTALAVQGGTEAAQPYRVEGCAVSGGAYQLTALAWQIEGAVGGGGYRLAALDAPSLQGSGCCCTYVPLVLRSYRP